MTRNKYADLMSEAKGAPSPAPSGDGKKTKAGRPRGKRVNKAEYSQASAYIPTVLYARVRKLLIDDPQQRDYSELVADVLEEWAEAQERKANHHTDATK